jgi:Protein of unknown function (DUF3224)
MTTRAAGTFEVKLTPQEQTVPVGRMQLDKTFSGDLTGTSQGEMLAFGTSVPDSAGYVALEKVTGTLSGRSGSFALQHFGVMNRGAPSLTIQVVPDSGTDDLEGLSGKMTIDRSDGVHKYVLEYELPA